MKCALSLILIAIFLCGGGLGSAKVLPKVPTPRISMPTRGLPSRGTLNKLFNRENAESLWNTVESSVDFFGKIKDLVKKEAPKEAELPAWKRFEFVECHPDKKNEICYSKCERQGEKYSWCFTSSEMSNTYWEVCHCQVREDVKKWLRLAKQKLMENKPTATAVKNEIVQWTIIGTVGLLTLLIATCILGRVIYRYRMERNAAGNNNAQD